MGPLCDRYGPRKMMALMLVAGAIPSGMAGLVKNANGLYAVRFFIGILGGTFVPCQTWVRGSHLASMRRMQAHRSLQTTAFFDKNIVGTANALVGGWGNLGGGVTFVVMVCPSILAAWCFRRLTVTPRSHSSKPLSTTTSLPTRPGGQRTPSSPSPFFSSSQSSPSSSEPTVLPEGGPSATRSPPLPSLRSTVTSPRLMPTSVRLSSRRWPRRSRVPRQSPKLPTIPSRMSVSFDRFAGSFGC